MNVITVLQTESICFGYDYVIHRKGFLKSNKYKIHDLSKISILTNDQGPIVDDVAFALFFNNDILVIPCGYPDYDEAYEYITKHFKVNFDVIIQAMGCTSNQEFVIWEKEYGMST